MMLSTIIATQYSKYKKQMSDSNVDQLMEMAKIAEAAERYDDMVQYISKALSNPRPGAKYVVLTDKERSLFSVAYKSVISSKRNSLRLLLSINNKTVITGNSGLIDELNGFASSIEDELKSSCLAATAICDKVLENPELPLEHRVYYLKMEGDYYRYLAEFTHDDEKKELAEKSEQKYQEAVNDAVACGMSEASPVYLGLVLNFSVFYYEVKGDSAKAREMASKAYDDAFRAMQGSEDLYTEAYQVLPLIKDNLTLWKAEDEK